MPPPVFTVGDIEFKKTISSNDDANFDQTIHKNNMYVYTLIESHNQIFLLSDFIGSSVNIIL